MSAERRIEIRQTPTFRKAFKRLSEKQKDRVDDEIDRLVENPELGTRERGDLAHLWVHKFRLEGQEILLGYAWDEGQLVLTLMNLAPHENFYQAARKRRDADLKFLHEPDPGT
ncbi:type II toxin-antitoxin system RelE/ParE family toxin [Thioalkalivibrio sp. ALE20]|uniref:type II toxin-antitoxin system RelE/ParE family toxin n=1 Tax=Thioalkalivibrio sp. ALE20 TaxID=545275 RepID=UPI0003A4387A|nr:type II toxin-antitoxin system RelE/ParE family toxin [Thioalkalivibrio sp. ALE20]